MHVILSIIMTTKGELQKIVVLEQGQGVSFTALAK